MARVGGRNAALAWITGILCLAVVAGLAYLAIPMVPVVRDWTVQTIAGPTPGPVRTARPGGPIECRDLYQDRLWGELVWAPQARLVPSVDAPVTAAAEVLAQAQPAVRFTCSWSSTAGTITTTYADVGADAGAAAIAALPALGFRCREVADRTRCVRTAGKTRDTVEVGGGRLLATAEKKWHPERYAPRVAARVWPR